MMRFEKRLRKSDSVSVGHLSRSGNQSSFSRTIPCVFPECWRVLTNTRLVQERVVDLVFVNKWLSRDFLLFGDPFS